MSLDCVECGDRKAVFNRLCRFCFYVTQGGGGDGDGGHGPGVSAPSSPDGASGEATA